MVQLLQQYHDNRDAQEAIRLIAYTRQSVFLTGKAGTGKSTLLRNLIAHVPKKYIVLASTGVAALNVGGQTIHSFFLVEPRPYLPQDKGAADLNEEKTELLRQVDLIIIDEISMVRCDLMQAIDLTLRKNLRSALPFGGKQLLVIGDLLQLPPVIDNKRAGEVEIISGNYTTPYFFSAKAFEEGFRMQIIELKRVYRQPDPAFVQVLNAVRDNTVQPSHLATLNTRHDPDYEPSGTELELILCTTNAIADAVNEQRLKALEGDINSYKALLTGDFEQEARSGGNRLPAELQLQLKTGAQVMFIKNDKERRWVNGTLGKITALEEEYVEVQLDEGEVVHRVDKSEWEHIEYKWNRQKEEIEKIVTGTFRQLPLKLAWAVTIHKSQGQTFQKVIIDLGNGAFATGQTYVALSRCTSLEGIRLKKKVTLRDVRYDPRIEFYLQHMMGGNMEVEKQRAIAEGIQARITEISAGTAKNETERAALEAERALLETS
ncbi:ATP-dependent DNA helicase [Chitinophaga rhizosphaerae]|uniref:ATP-dependent DNA helicase n=1 Tax=Chitinophaga rhizosphaerae TaxID=1864947 RepID=UPI000F800AD1|nr:DEAD/DEAH box helicase [Chitinophaga rhizosphaerae]